MQKRVLKEGSTWHREQFTERIFFCMSWEVGFSQVPETNFTAFIVLRIPTAASSQKQFQITLDNFCICYLNSYNPNMTSDIITTLLTLYR
jgi:hypothetical protein